MRKVSAKSVKKLAKYFVFVNVLLRVLICVHNIQIFTRTSQNNTKTPAHVKLFSLGINRLRDFLAFNKICPPFVRRPNMLYFSVVCG